MPSLTDDCVCGHQARDHEDIDGDGEELGECLRDTCDCDEFFEVSD